MTLSSPSKLLDPSDFISVAMRCDTMAVDTETNGKDVRDGRGFCIGISAAVKLNDIYHSAYFPVAHTSSNVTDSQKKFLFNLIASRERILMHNAKFDIISLQTAGFVQEMKRWYCTMLMAHMLNENSPKGLDWLARNALNIPGKKKPPEWEAWFAIYGWDPRFPAAVMGLYAGEDAVLCYKLFEAMYPHFVNSGFDGRKM
jgi:ribonuclease D